MAEIVNLTLEEKEQLAEVYDDKRMTLEDVMAVALVAFFRLLSAEFQRIYARTGVIFDANSLSPELQVLLKEHYRKAINYFAKHYQRMIEAEIKKAVADGDEERVLFLTAVLDVREDQQDEIDEILTVWMSGTAITHAGMILNTTNDVLLRSVQVSADKLQEELERPPTQRELAKASAKEALERNRNRVGTISETEMGTVMNEAMATEAGEMSDQLPSLGFKIMGTWITERDSKVRPDHKRVHGESKPYGEPYLVGGELMRWPLDTSLGASAKNIMNCRCVLVWT